jgi:hypothetical protein
MVELRIGLIVILGAVLTGCMSGHEVVVHQEFLEPGQHANVHVDCPDGMKVFGGGFNIETPEEVEIFESSPSDGSGNTIDNGWNLFVHNIGTQKRQATVSAVCAKIK